MPDDEVERLEPHESDDLTDGAPSAADAQPDTAAVAEETPESDGARGRSQVVGLIIGIVLMVAAIGFAVSIVVFGSSSPTDVVQDLFESLEQEDVAGLAASLAPSEHRLVLEPALRLVEEAERLGFLADVDPSAVGGIDLEFSNLVFESEVLAEDLVWVAIKGDSASTISTDELPIGPLLERYLPDDWADDINTDRETASFTDVAGLAVVKEDGEWYVSLTYTIAEAARRDSGAEFPQTQPFAEPAGAATPEEALEKATLAVINVDIRELIDVLEPGETAAFRRYADLFIDDWDEAVDEFHQAMKDAGFSYSVDEVVTGSKGLGGDTVVWVETIRKFRVELDAPEVGTLFVSRDADCLTIGIPDTLLDELGPAFGDGVDVSQLDGRRCVDFDTLFDDPATGANNPFEGQEELLYGMPVGGPLFERWFESVESFEDASSVQVQAVDTNGRWYVSPIGTSWRWLFAFTGTLDQELLRDVGDDIELGVDDPDMFADMMEQWLADTLDASGITDGFDPATGEPIFGADLLAPFADIPNVLLVWSPDLDDVTAALTARYGDDLIIEIIDGRELHAMFVANLGPFSTGGMAAEEFPHGIHIRAVDIDTLVQIFNGPGIFDMYRAIDLGR